MENDRERIERIRERMSERIDGQAEPTIRPPAVSDDSFDIGFAPPDPVDPMDRLGDGLLRLDAALEATDRLVRSSVARAASPVGLREQNFRQSIRKGLEEQVQAVQGRVDGFGQALAADVAGTVGGAIESARFISDQCSTYCVPNDRGGEDCFFECPGGEPIPISSTEGPIEPTPPTIPTPPTPGLCPAGWFPAGEVLPADVIGAGFESPDACVSGISCEPCDGGGWSCSWSRLESMDPIFGPVTSPHIVDCTVPVPPVPTPPFPTPTPQPEPGCPPPPCMPICVPECEVPEVDCEEECPCPETKIWFSCETELFICLPEDDEPPEEGGPWNEVLADETCSDLIKQCRKPEEPEEEPEPEPGRPPFAEVQPCIFLPPTATSHSAGIFTDVVDIGSCIEAAVGFNVGPFLDNPISAFVGGGLAMDACKVDQAIDGITHIFGGKHCFSGEWINIMRVQGLIGTFNEWTGGGFDDPLMVARHNARYLCPVDIPTLAESNHALLTDSISAETWRCWTRANNQDDKNYDNVLDAQRSRLSVGELNSLRRRKLMQADEYNRRVRQLGFLHQSEANEMYKLSEQIPFITDIIRMMVRDADDDKVVKQFGLDDLFDRKFGGQLRDWAESQGLTEQNMRYLWRSHWTIPPPTQLFQMFHRLTGPTVPADVRVTEDDIKEALVQQDIAPFWVDRVLALSFKLPTRRDILRMIEGNVVDQNEAIEMYLKIGFDLPDAQRLFRLARQRIRKRIRSNSAVTAYSKGELNQFEMGSILEAEGFPVDMQQEAIEAGGIKALQQRRKKCISAIRTRYFDGEFRDDEIESLLIAQGMDGMQASTLAEGMLCEKQARGKDASSTQLCEWFRQGSIDSVEFSDRLINLGWTRDDTAKMIRSCEIRLQKEINADERRRLAERLKRQKEAERAAAKLAKALERESNKRAGKIRKRATSMKQKRAWMLDVAENMAKKMSLSVDDVKVDVNSIYDTLRAVGLWTTEEVLQTMRAASEDPTIRTVEGLLSEANNLLQLAIFPSPLELDDLPENVEVAV